MLHTISTTQDKRGKASKHQGRDETTWNEMTNEDYGQDDGASTNCENKTSGSETRGRRFSWKIALFLKRFPHEAVNRAAQLFNKNKKIKKFWGKCKSLPQWGCDIVKLSCTVHVFEEGLSFSHEGNEVIRKRQQYEWNTCKERQTLMESDEVRHCGMKTMTWKHDNWDKKNKIRQLNTNGAQDQLDVC